MWYPVLFDFVNTYLFFNKLIQCFLLHICFSKTAMVKIFKWLAVTVFKIIMRSQDISRSKISIFLCQTLIFSEHFDTNVSKKFPLEQQLWILILHQLNNRSSIFETLNSFFSKWRFRHKSQDSAKPPEYVYFEICKTHVLC